MYKIIQNNKVIDIVRVPRFISFLASGYIAITDKTSAQGIVGSDNQTIYSFEPIDYPGVNVVTAEEITFEEFSRLQDLLNSDQVVIVDKNIVTSAQQETIKRLSYLCREKIISGFSVRLSDGKFYNFKLTVEDQLNLMAIENQLNLGEKTFIYHATNEPCKAFSREDMSKIIRYFKHYTLYHTTYFNVAKQYINSLTDLNKITNFAYGDDVSEIVEDKNIKKILKTGGNF
jgi:uncharacterized protein YvpB